MPIYAYKCAQCGNTYEALQKLADKPLTVCPSCGEHALEKQLTAPSHVVFKGTGYYATDFKGK